MQSVSSSGYYANQQMIKPKNVRIKFYYNITMHTNIKIIYHHIINIYHHIINSINAILLFIYHFDIVKIGIKITMFFNYWITQSLYP